MFTRKTRVQRLYFILEDMNAVMTEHDYAEALEAKFDMEIQSEAFGFNHNLSIESNNCVYKNNYHTDVSNNRKVKMDLN